MPYANADIEPVASAIRIRSKLLRMLPVVMSGFEMIWSNSRKLYKKVRVTSTEQV
jgi:hypothetical protein